MVKDILTEEELEGFSTIDDDIFEENAHKMSKLFGWHDPVQEHNMEMDCVFPTNGISYNQRTQLTKDQFEELSKHRESNGCFYFKSIQNSMPICYGRTEGESISG